MSPAVYSLIVPYVIKYFIDIFKLNSDPFACGCDVAWLIRDNRHLLPAVRNGYCGNSSLFPTRPFQNLDPNFFAECPSTPSSNGSSRNEWAKSLSLILTITFFIAIFRQMMLDV